MKICFKFLKLYFVVSELMHIIKIGQVGQGEIILGCKKKNNGSQYLLRVYYVLKM